MIDCCGFCIVFYKKNRIHVNFRPYRYSRKTLEEERVREEQFSKEMQVSKENLESVLSEMQELCKKVKHPEEMIEN